VAEFDHRWTPNAAWSVHSTVVGSQVDQRGVQARDSGAQLRIDHQINTVWRQQLYAVHLGDGLQLNDFGFLERNNFNYARYELGRRVTDLAATSAFNAHNWRYAVSRRSNDHGLLIGDAWAFNRASDRRDGGNEFFDIAGWTAGHDDLITRGNGVVDVPSKLFAFYERSRPRKGHWAFSGNARYAAEGLGGPGKGAIRLSFEPTYHVNDTLSFQAGLEANHNPDWLLWRPDNDPATRDNRLATFRADALFLNAGMTWLIDNKQELRVRLEAIGLDAQMRQAYRVSPDGVPVAVDEVVPDFALRNLGFQVRYRYELAPLSYLYVAYVRGGSLFETDAAGGFRAQDQLRDAFELRDSEQLLVKLSYRFEI